MKTNPTCNDCGVKLNEENWYPSRMRCNIYLCKKCINSQKRTWKKRNPKKVRSQEIKAKRRSGVHPFDINKDCAQFLGIHIAEQVLSHVFKDVERMPMNNPGYDFICNRGKKIDVKSACIQKTGKWCFNIRHNTTADFFLCLAFDNREDLNPLYAWLLPGPKFCHLGNTTISQSTIHKWDEYRLDITKIHTCCDTLKK